MDHPGQLCRLCAQQCTFAEIRYLFNDDEQVVIRGENDDDELSGLDLVELINMSLPIKVTQTDLLPKQVCFQCIEKVKASCEFASSCLAAEQELQKLCDENKFMSETIHSKNEKNLKPMLTDRELEAVLKETNIVEMTDPDDESGTPTEADYCCPLCCDGQMTQRVDGPAEETAFDDVGEVIDNDNDFEESFDDVMDETPCNLIQDLEQEDDEDPVVEDLDEEDVSSKGPGQTQGEDSDDLMFPIDEENEQNSEYLRRKKPKLFGERGRGRGKRKGRGRGRPRGSSNGITNPSSKKDPEDDTLMWIDEENQQSVPLVQCVRCSGWLPGFAACLQHTLSSHVEIEEGKKLVECSRCEELPFESEKSLVDHFTEKHCADLVVELTDTGTYSVVDKSEKGNIDGRRFRNVAYHCCICLKGFSWLLSFLRHSCLPVDNDKLHCEECDKTFSNRQRYVFHKQFHGQNTPALECDVCGESFESDSSLYDHARFSHLDENIVCDECGKNFRSEKGLHTHQQNAHNMDPDSTSRHKCPECGKGYRDKQTLREHMVTHLSVKPFPCDKCDRAYNRHSRLKQHQLTHVYSDSMDCYECVTCGMAFPTEESALEHSQFEKHTFQGVTLTKVYRCEFCDSLFSRAESLNQHRPSHDGIDKPYVCHICGAAFSSYSRVTTHKSTHGVYDQIEPRENDFSIPKHFLCEHCNLSYLYWSYLRTHRKTRHSDNPYVVSCKFCPEKFKNSWSAVYHRKKVHEGGGNAKEWRKKDLSCSVCGNLYLYQHTLDMHMEKKHGPYKDGERENYQCEECGKVFKYQSSLDLHQKMHLGEKTYLCQECNKYFLTIATWRNHVKRCHEGIRRHKCLYCSKSFFHKVSRDDHHRVHTGEKPFECQYCHRSFRLKSMLTNHAKVHNDDRPYPCDICGTSFRRMVHMKQHRMLHTGERPYECPMCHLDFRLKQELRRHLKSKHSEPPLPQEDTPFVYTQ